MKQSLIDLVWQRARFCCEYCQLPREFMLIPFEIDHIIARKHGGRTVAENLCISCYFCNSFKGSNIAGFDTRTGKLVQLFNPRRHHWRRCFEWAGPRLVGRTPIGRATIQVLSVNNPQAILLRKLLIEEGVFPRFA